MARRLTRRTALGTMAGAVAAIGLPRPAAAANGAAARIAEFTGGAPPDTGGIELELPEIAENGNTVPMTVRVASPMTPADHCEAVLVVADGNPNPGVAHFRFSPLSGRAEASTRIRLAASQTVTAVARMSDGRFLIAERPVVVTVGGCIG